MGQMDAPAPAKMIPPARPLRSSHQSLSQHSTGVYRTLPVAPQTMPCRTTSCHAWVAQLERSMLPVYSATETHSVSLT